MKKITALIFLAFVIQTIALSQSCLPEGITFSTQVEIDNFQTNNPNCTEIEGDVIINGDEISNLNGLSVLLKIQGDLTIYSNTSLNDLTGLENISSVDGHLLISNNENLYSLAGLESISSTGRDLRINNNNDLIDLSGINNLSSIGEYFEISNNNSLLNLTGLENLQYIGESIIIQNNNVLINITSLNSLSSIGRGLLVSGNVSLTSLAGLNNLTYVTGFLRIENNHALVNLSGLVNLTSVEGIKIRNNNALTNLNGLENLTSNGNLSIVINNNQTLTSVDGIMNINSNSIESLSIYNNYLLSTCAVESVCNYLASPSAIVNISNNATGCNSNEEVEELCNIIYPPCLTDGISFITQASIDNFQTNYPSCYKIGGDVNISGSNITNLNGLNVLASISGNLKIHENNSLINLTGLDNLSSIEGDLIISNNNNLTALIGIDNIEPASINNIRIIDNPILSECGVKSICNFLLSPNGVIEVYNNSDGCNSPLQVEETCGTIYQTCLPYGKTFHNQEAIDNFQANYPNCTKIGGQVTISGEYIISLSSFSILTSIGETLWIHDNNSLTNLSGLNNILSIGGSLNISNNNTLMNLTGLESLKSVDGQLVIMNNNVITDLLGLSDLTSIQKELVIWYNDGLTSLYGIENITYQSMSDIDIQNNVSLATCEVQSVCNFLLNPNGYIRIYDNSFGCNSQTEVKDLCTNWIPSTDIKSQFTIYPNPVKKGNSISIRTELEIDKITIFNQTGQRVLSKNNNKYNIDISMLERGMYILELLSNELKFRQKLIIK